MKKYTITMMEYKIHTDKLCNLWWKTAQVTERKDKVLHELYDRSSEDRDEGFDE